MVSNGDIGGSGNFTAGVGKLVPLFERGMDNISETVALLPAKILLRKGRGAVGDEKEGAVEAKGANATDDPSVTNLL